MILLIVFLYSTHQQEKRYMNINAIVAGEMNLLCLYICIYILESNIPINNKNKLKREK